MATEQDLAGPGAVASGAGSSGRWRVGPVVALLLLAPVVSEVLYGATRISVIFVLIPQVACWGCGALLIREAVVRRRRGWIALLLLGLALAVAEECIIQQTSLAPMAGLARQDYGRAAGVNWVYLLWALGYEGVWVVVLPVRLVEWLFPDRRKEAWLGRRGLILAGLAFLAGSFVAWYSWTQVARTKVLHMPEYRPPAAHLLAATGAIGLLAAASLGPLGLSPSRRPGRPAPGPSATGAAAFVLGLPWTVLVLMAFGAMPAVPPGWTLIAGAAWAVATLVLFARWTSGPSWGDRHRLAVVRGGVFACMAGGFLIFWVGGAPPIDWIGKAVLNVVAAAWLARPRRAAGGGRDDPDGSGRRASGLSFAVI